MRFRIEDNPFTGAFWYTLVSGNGNTIMTSKATYTDRSVAKRAAERARDALQSSEIIVEVAAGRKEATSKKMTAQEGRMHPEKSPYAR